MAVDEAKAKERFVLKLLFSDGKSRRVCWDWTQSVCEAMRHVLNWLAGRDSAREHGYPGLGLKWEMYKEGDMVACSCQTEWI